MSRIESLNEKVQWKDPKINEQKGHKDYEVNLRHSESLCKNIEKHLLNGMKVKISDSEHLQKALLIISWCPGMHEKKGNYATPIFLHQYASDFKKTTESILNFYMKFVGDYQRENPKQTELLPANLKV
jgi:hypothetical protein